MGRSADAGTGVAARAPLLATPAGAIRRRPSIRRGRAGTARAYPLSLHDALPISERTTIFWVAAIERLAIAISPTPVPASARRSHGIRRAVSNKIGRAPSRE